MRMDDDVKMKSILLFFSIIVHQVLSMKMLGYNLCLRKQEKCHLVQLYLYLTNFLFKRYLDFGKLDQSPQHSIVSDFMKVHCN